MKITVYLILVIAMIVVGPLLTIASLNTLFNLSIAYSLEAWASVAWLCLVTFGNVTSAIERKK